MYYNTIYSIMSCCMECKTECFFLISRFKDQIHDVFKMLSADVQVILLSATMPDDVLEVSRCFMRDPVRILVQKEEVCKNIIIRNDFFLDLWLKFSTSHQYFILYQNPLITVKRNGINFPTVMYNFNGEQPILNYSFDISCCMSVLCSHRLNI